MPLVHRRTLVSRSIFRKLPNGAIYYGSAGTTGPFVKTGRTTRLTTSSDPQQDPDQTTVSDTSIGVVRVSKFVMDAQDAIGG